MSTAPRPRADTARQFSAQTLTWLANQSHQVRRVVHSVWATLTELEQATHHPGALNALRSILTDHQPTSRTGRCRACRRLSWRHLWRRRPFPCGVWMTTHLELQGLFNGNRAHPPVSHALRGWPS